MADTANINELSNKPVMIKNKKIKRYLFSDGDSVKGNRGDEKGWTVGIGIESPKVVGTGQN